MKTFILFFARKIDGREELSSTKALLVTNPHLSHEGVEDPREINAGNFFDGQGIFSPDKLRASTIINNYCSLHSERDSILPLSPYLFVSAVRYSRDGGVLFDTRELNSTQRAVMRELGISLTVRTMPNNPGIGLNFFVPAKLLEDEEFVQATNIRSIM